MLQISTMANFDTEVYELLKFFLHDQAINILKRSAIALRLPKRVQAHNSAVSLTIL